MTLFLNACSNNSMKSSELTIIRGEESGVLNIVSVSIIIDGKHFWIAKEPGSNKMNIPSGRHTFLLEYSNPYTNEEKKWAKIEINITRKSIFARLQPVLNKCDAAYTGDWNLVFTDEE